MMKVFDINNDRDMEDGAEHMHNLLTETMQKCGATMGFIMLHDKNGKVYTMAIPSGDPEGLADELMIEARKLG
jgi:cobalamin-dependent methionine synthase I